MTDTSPARKYPANYQDLNTWTNPAYMTGVEDNLCAYKYIAANTAENDIVNLSGYGFDIPIAATITKETIAIRQGMYPTSIETSTSFNVTYGASTVGLDGTKVHNLCPSSAWNTLDIPSYLWIPVADLNAENFTSYVKRATSAVCPANDVRVDAVYIEVSFTVPSAAEGAVKDGLAWISQCKPKGRSLNTPLFIRRMP